VTKHEVYEEIKTHATYNIKMVSSQKRPQACNKMTWPQEWASKIYKTQAKMAIMKQRTMNN